MKSLPYLKNKTKKIAQKYRKPWSGSIFTFKILIKLELLRYRYQFPCNFSFSFIFLILTSWIWMSILNADPDPGGKIKTDPCGSGSTALARAY